MSDMEELNAAFRHELAITLEIYGKPEPRGSKRAFIMPTKDGRMSARIVDANKRSGPWMNDVARIAAAEIARRGISAPAFTGPVAIWVTFVMPRPSSHFRANGSVKPTAPELHVCRPDATKLLRGLEDALKGIMWRDDSQVAGQIAMKQYGCPEMTRVIIGPYQLPTSVPAALVGDIRPETGG